MWPYSYAACDLGTFPNQTKNGQPAGAVGLSYLPGQRTSACSCPGSDHPGPSVSTGRSAPEIDVLEAEIDVSVWEGQVSQSLQVAPFNANYQFDNASSVSPIQGGETTFNTYTGGLYQQALSALTYISSSDYNNTGYATFAYEWWSNPSERSSGYVQWYSEGQEAWRATYGSLAGDSTTGISSRIIPEEPMVRRYLRQRYTTVLTVIHSISSSTLGWLVSRAAISQRHWLTFAIASFQEQDFKHLEFPSSMYIDYVRVYQRSDVTDGVGCNPASHPTTDYINKYARLCTPFTVGDDLP